MKHVTRRLAAAAIVLAAVFGPAGAASAHPLGNFTVNRYTAIQVGDGGVVLDLVTDMAEIPAFQTREKIDTNHDKTVDSTEGATWAEAQCATLVGDVKVTADGNPVRFKNSTVRALSFPAGQAGLVTLRLECSVASASKLTAGTHELTYTDNTFAGRVGWHEVVAQVTFGSTLAASDVPTESITARLTQYPKDVLRSPVNQRSAALRVNVAGGGGGTSASIAATAATTTATTRTVLPKGVLPRGLDRATRAFTDLVARRNLTLGFGIVAVLLAMVLGSFHALAPGHGKTVMAAYIVGQRGSVRQAALIGLTVTATHTAGVVVLGVVLTTSKAIAPERLYPWLGLTSGLLLAGIGLTLLRRARRTARTAWFDPNATLTVPDEWDTSELDVLVGSSVAHAATGTTHVAVHDVPHVSAAPHENHPHNHPHDHDHPHEHDHPHDHPHDHTGGTRGRFGRRHRVSPAARRPGPEQVHSHGGLSHSHPTFDPALGWKSLVGVGFAGGLVPSPSALLVLLGAITLGRTWFGLVLVTAYGVGMAIMLTVAGLLLVRARGWFDRRAARYATASPLLRFARYLPLCTSVVIIVLGLTLAGRELGKL